MRNALVGGLAVAALVACGVAGWVVAGAAGDGCGGAGLALTRDAAGEVNRPEVVVRDDGDDEGDGWRVVSGDLVATEPAWAPDGAWLTFVSADGSYESAGPGASAIVRVDDEGGDLRTLVEAGTNRSPAVSPDGDEVAFVRAPTGVVGQAYQVAVVPAEGGDVRDLFPPITEAIADTAWSPDGTQVAYTTGGPRAQVWVVDAAGGEPRRVADVAGANWLDWAGDDTLLVGTLGAEDGALARVDAESGAVVPLAEHATAPAVAGDDVHLLQRQVVTGADGGESRIWHLAQGRLTDDGLEAVERTDDAPVPFLYDYLGLAAEPCG